MFINEKPKNNGISYTGDEQCPPQKNHSYSLQFFTVSSLHIYNIYNPYSLPHTGKNIENENKQLIIK